MSNREKIILLNKVNKVLKAISKHDYSKSYNIVFDNICSVNIEFNTYILNGFILKGLSEVLKPYEYRIKCENHNLIIQITYS